MASEQELMDLLRGKGLKTITQELERVNIALEKTSYVAKEAFDMGASKEALEKYSNMLGNDISRALTTLYGKSKQLNTLEEKRHAITVATSKALDQGNKNEQNRLKTLSDQLDKHIEINKQLEKGQKSGLFSAFQGAAARGGGMISGALRSTPFLGKMLGGAALGGGALGALGGAAAMAAPLAIAGYGASRMMSGYSTYKQMLPDVVSGRGRFGKEGMSQIDLYGSTQGYSAVERAGMLRQLGEAGLAGETDEQAGTRASTTMGKAEKLSRTLGIDAGQMIGMMGQAQQMSGGAANTEQMMAEAVASGVNRTRLSGFMEKSLRLGEQVYAATGNKNAVTDQNKLLAGMIAGASDKQYAERYGAEIVGRVGERVRSVGMGGGDLATQGYMYRALSSKYEKANKGKAMSRYEFMAQAQEGAGGGNIRALLDQSEEFGGKEGTQMAFTQMFGLTFKQTDTLQRMKGVSSKAIDQKVKDFQKDNFAKTPEGNLLDSIAKNTNQQAKIGKDTLGIASQMLDVQRNIDTLVAPVAGILNSIAGFFGVSPSKGSLEEAQASGDIEVALSYGAGKGNKMDKRTLAAYKKLEDDSAKITMSDLKAFKEGTAPSMEGMKKKGGLWEGVMGESSESEEKRRISAQRVMGFTKEHEEKLAYMQKTPEGKRTTEQKEVITCLKESIKVQREAITAYKEGMSEQYFKEIQKLKESKDKLKTNLNVKAYTK